MNKQTEETPQTGPTRYAVQVVLAVEQYDGTGRLVDAKQSQPMTVSVLSADALRETWGVVLDQMLGAIRGG